MARRSTHTRTGSGETSDTEAAAVCNYIRRGQFQLTEDDVLTPHICDTTDSCTARLRAIVLRRPLVDTRGPDAAPI